MSQLIINTITTIVTFLLVALLQNAQDAGERRGAAEAEGDRRWASQT